MPMHPTISKRKPYSPYFNPNQFSPALWLDGADASTLITDGAASFTAASSQYLEVADNSTLRLGNTLFIACWIYPTTFNASPTYFIAKDENTLGTREFGISFDVNGTVLFSLGGSSSGGGIPNLTLNAWNFVACWYDSQDNKHYRNVNGTVSTGTTITPYSAFGTLASFRLGSRIVSDPYFNGRLDSVVYLKPSVGWLVSNATALCSYLYNSGAGRRSSDFINSSLYSGSGAVSWWDLDEVPVTATTLTQRKDRIGTNHLTDNNYVGYVSSTVCGGLVQYDGDPIKQWRDKSGNARHVTAASDAARPTYVTNIGGVPAVLTDGTDDTLAATFASPLSQPSTYFIVCRYVAYGYGLLGGTVHANQNQISATSSRLYAGTQLNGTAAALNTTFLITSVFNTTSSVRRHNGTQIMSGDVGTQAQAGVRVGSTPLSEYGNNYYMEVQMYNRLLSAAEIANVERYLAAKWGITLS